MDTTMPDEFLITTSYSADSDKGKDSNNKPCLLSNELLTFIVAQYLPDEAYEDIFCDADGKNMDLILLDHSILDDDPFLKLLVAKTLQIAIKKCVTDHGIHLSGRDGDWTSMISHFVDNLRLNHRRNSFHFHEVYGKTIVLEELHHLKILNDQMKALWDDMAHQVWDQIESQSLWLSDGPWGSASDEKATGCERIESPASKRPKHQE
jgi:hypothetical protein